MASTPVAPRPGTHDGWHRLPMAGFDLETTGADPLADRIVTAAVCRTGLPPRLWMVDPGVPIPPQATAVHGITGEQASAHGRRPAEVLPEIVALLSELARERVPIVVYRAAYDLTLLDRELRRNGNRGLRDDLLVIDPYVLDRRVDPRRPGRRTLTDVCAFYGVPLVDAHTAAADAQAAVELAQAIAARHPQLAAMPLADLHAAQRRWHAGYARELQKALRRRGAAEIVNKQWPRIAV